MMTLPAVIDQQTGELITLITAEHLLQAAGLTDLAQADTEALAEFSGNADHLAAIAREAKGQVGEEILTRLDKAGRWSARFGDYNVKAPSPTAGTTTYDVDRLSEVLADLLDRDLITADAAEAALELVVPDPYRKLRLAGVNALVKIGGEVAAAVSRCRVTVDAPRRSASVKRAGS